MTGDHKLRYGDYECCGVKQPTKMILVTVDAARNVTEQTCPARNENPTIGKMSVTRTERVERE